MTAVLPTISIVTPSFNQGKFLDDAMRSVLTQGYPNLEYVVMDGGSSDCSVEVIRKYEDRLIYWESQPDQGQYDAINRGFARTTGGIMAWLNSDDMYTPLTFSLVADIFASFPQIEWLTSMHPVTWDAHGQAVKIDFTGGFSRQSFEKGGNFPGKGSHGRRWIQQESTFWRRSLWERAGGRLDTSLQLAADFELWARLFQHADLYGVNVQLGGFREHGDQLSVHRREQYMHECEETLRSYGRWPCSKLEDLLRGGFWKVFRLHSLTPFPLPVRLALIRAGVFYPTQVLVRSGGKWEIISGLSV